VLYAIWSNAFHRSVRHRRRVTCDLETMTEFMASVARWQRCEFISYSTFRPRLERLLTARGVAGDRGASVATAPGSGVQGMQNGEKINI
jgi:hypothetical protein